MNSQYIYIIYKNVYIYTDECVKYILTCIR